MTRTTPSARTTKRTPVTWLRGGGLSNLVFALPLIVVFAVFSWSPIIQSFVMSVQKTNLITSEWVGFDNFARVLADPLLGTAIVNTLYFAGLALLFGFPLPILLAVLMSEVRRGKGFYSALAYLPVIIPPVVAVLLWKFFYDASPTGVFNSILGWVGIPPQPWLQSSATAMPSLVLEATWAAAGGSIIIYLAALLSVPPELYDAAEVDGASIWRKIWHVTLPQLRGVIFIMLILQIIATAQIFLEPFLFTGGGPNNATVTVLLLIYRYAFQNSLGGNYGEATALSVMLAIVLAILSILYFKLTDRWSSS
ncbi:MAG: sugar ABC transporter permease [Rhodoglobus sp.]|jgi:multiple sugar transport system permease protein|nr:sugar ABC transporter permease [Rhodoglobus sp.]